MVSRVQARVVQQGLPERRVTARSARPSTLALLGGPLSSAEAHRFLLVGGGHQYVMTSITRIGIRCPSPPARRWPLRWRGGNGRAKPCVPAALRRGCTPASRRRRTSRV